MTAHLPKHPGELVAVSLVEDSQNLLPSGADCAERREPFEQGSPTVDRATYVKRRRVAGGHGAGGDPSHSEDSRVSTDHTQTDSEGPQSSRLVHVQVPPVARTGDEVGGMQLDRDPLAPTLDDWEPKVVPEPPPVIGPSVECVEPRSVLDEDRRSELCALFSRVVHVREQHATHPSYPVDRAPPRAADVPQED